MMSLNQPAVSPLSGRSAAHFGAAASGFRTVTAKSRSGLLGFPARVWARIQVLFFALVLIKGILILGLRKHLYEIHWRVGGEDITPAGQVAFYLFVVLGLFCLVDLGRCCRSVGIRAVRAANFTVLGLGLLFIFFNFHTGDKKYLYPIMTGVLKWQSLGPYLSLDFFFPSSLSRGVAGRLWLCVLPAGAKRPRKVDVFSDPRLRGGLRDSVPPGTRCVPQRTAGRRLFRADHPGDRPDTR